MTSSSSRKFVASTQAEAGEVLGVGPRQVADYIARGCPGRAKCYPIREMIAWCKDHIWNPRHEPQLTGEGPKRKEIAELLKIESEARLRFLKLQQEQGDLIPREKVHEGMVLFSEIMKGGLDQIQRDHPEAAEVLADTLNELEQTYRERFGDPE